MTIKFTQETLAILKNFSNINQSILINPGQLIASIASNKTVLGVAEVSETFDTTIAIHNLPQFLNIMSMFKEPSIDIVAGRQVVIHEGKSKVFYTFAEPSMIERAPKGFADQEHLVSFELEAKVLLSVMKATGVMGLPEIAIKGGNGVLTIGGVNTKDKSASTFQHEVGVTDKTFQAFYLVERFCAIPKDYKVSVSPLNIKLEAINQSPQEPTLKYWIGNQEYSVFPKK